MTRRLDVTSLDMECHDDGTTKVTVWVKCWSSDDIDDVIAWLKLAKSMMKSWETIRKKEQAHGTNRNVQPIR
jgi:hypothetical protein